MAESVCSENMKGLCCAFASDTLPTETVLFSAPGAMERGKRSSGGGGYGAVCSGVVKAVADVIKAALVTAVAVDMVWWWLWWW